MQFNVPQFLDVEDKVIGPLTMKQFGYLGGCGLLLFFVYALTPNFGSFLMIGIPIGVFSLALAFIRINGRPFIYFVMAFFRYLFKPKLFIWKKKN